MRDYVTRQFTLSKRVTSPTWGPPPPCKQALPSIQNPCRLASTLNKHNHFLSLRLLVLSLKLLEHGRTSINVYLSTKDTLFCPKGQSIRSVFSTKFNSQ